jgi:hypothetical protein
MSKKVKVWIEPTGAWELMKSDMVVEQLRVIANEKLANATGNYTTAVHNSGHRKYITIAPADKQTYFRNLRANYLIKAVGI